MSKVLHLPVRKRSHELERFLLAPGVIERHRADKAISWGRRLSGAVLILSLVGLAIKLF